MDKTREEGYNVIYSDTDGYAFQLGDHSREDAEKLLEKLNKNLPGIMELDLEGFFKRGIWVTKRSGDFGAKKKYALIDYDGNMKVRGFETVRRDWCDLARETQNTVLEKILKEGNEKEAMKFVREMVKKIKNRDVEKKKLIIRNQLKKSLDEYKAESPHVVVARKMKKRGLPVDEGMMVSYYIAESRKKNPLVRERARLPDEEGRYDINYYLEKQILPAVENIFQVFDVTKDEILEGKKQTKLDGFGSS
jgi:DNA polymerase I